MRQGLEPLAHFCWVSFGSVRFHHVYLAPRLLHVLLDGIWPPNRTAVLWCAWRVVCRVMTDRPADNVRFTSHGIAHAGPRWRAHPLVRAQRQGPARRRAVPVLAVFSGRFGRPMCCCAGRYQDDIHELMKQNPFHTPSDEEIFILRDLDRRHTQHVHARSRTHARMHVTRTGSARRSGGRTRCLRCSTTHARTALPPAAASTRPLSRQKRALARTHAHAHTGARKADVGVQDVDVFAGDQAAGSGRRGERLARNISVIIAA